MGKKCLVLLLVLSGILLARTSFAQDENKAAGNALDIERFKPSLDSQGMILTEAGQGEEGGDLNLGFYLHYAHRPLVLRDVNGKVIRPLVDYRLGASFYVSMGLLDWLQVGIEVPTVFYQKGEFPNIGGGDLGLAKAALGDIRVVPKFTILRQSWAGVSLALVTPLTLPSGDERAFAGSDTVSAMPTIALSRSLLDGLLTLAGNLGFWLREGAEYQDLDASHEFFYRLGAMVRFAQYYGVSGEVQGGARLKTIGENEPQETPLEWLLAFHYATPWDINLTVGGAVGTLPGWGTPNGRAFLGLAWAPRDRDRDDDGVNDDQDRCPDDGGPAENDGCPWSDTDSDGLTDDRDGCPNKAGPVENKGCPYGDADGDAINDNVDKCPNEAGPTDNKGCPWGDEDGDGLTDNVDKCPKQAGPSENKGCPWSDSDNDGLTDNLDKCPKQAGPKENNGCPLSDADGDGVRDEKDLCPTEAGPVANEGCPWGDADEDGLTDDVDQCPKQKEDKDGFEDTDGCPDPDNDKDGVLDEKDKCRDEPETINGYRDEDGCPDKGKVVVIVKKGKIEILQKVYFATGRAVIKRKSFKLLDQVAQTMRAHDEIKRIRVDGHTDSQGGERANQRLSQRRAEAVRKYLIKKGVSGERLVAKGFGEAKPISPNTTAKGREQNRRVEFVIVDE